MHLATATAELTQSLGRSPTPRELAGAVGCTVEEVVEGMESAHAYAPVSLDAAAGPHEQTTEIGVDDEDLHLVVVRESVRPLLDSLGAREKKILLLRYFKNMTQAQIAEEIGVSQMHVSRLLRRTLDELRSSLESD